MKKVTLEDIRMLAEASRAQLWEDARNMDRDVKIYLHWTAGDYNTKFDDYHVCIDGVGRIWLMTDDLSEVLAHTWRRNSGAIGVTLCCCLGGSPENLGKYPPTEIQIEVMAEVVAVLAKALWLTIDREHVLTHGEAADNMDGLEVPDPYGPCNGCERWDLQYLGTDDSPAYTLDYDSPAMGGNVLRGKANWYLGQGV